MSEAKEQGLDHHQMALRRIMTKGHWDLMAYDNNAWPFSKQKNLLGPRAVQ